jgi:hypothetical protein
LDPVKWVDRDRFDLDEEFMGTWSRGLALGDLQR